MKRDLPYSTSDYAGVPGTIKTRYEDFRVEEIPAYEASGSGEHVYFTVEKTGLSTSRAIRDIAGALRVRPRDIGYAGLKDARGITVQTLSLAQVNQDSIAALEIPRIKILKVGRHKNKFKMGHLKGNMFCLKLRNTDVARLDDLKAISEDLTSRGVPNYFGAQRFGNRGDTWEVGKALLAGDFDEAAAIIAGKASDADTGRVLEARELFDKGRFDAAAAAWPRGFNECVRVCTGLAGQGGNSKRAVMGLDRKIIKLYVSAYQSHLFNRVLARRLENFDKIENGDLAWKHINGAAFMVEDSEAEAPRAKSFEISATGPLFGPKMTMPRHGPLELEEDVLTNEGILRNHFAQSGPLKCPGGRRPLRFQPADFKCDASEDEHGSFIELRFTLAPGCYATSVLREVCKDKLEIVS